MTLTRYLALALTLAAMTSPASSKSKAERMQASAQLLEHAEYPCSNCLFGKSDYYFCFKTDNRILIGHEKIPTLSWWDPNKNYLTKAHKSWNPWQAEGANQNIQFDDKHIWVPRTGGKEVRLTQDYNKDIFIANTQCRAAVRKQPS